jgi:arachidonate 15-lipoxygenase
LIRWWLRKAFWDFFGWVKMTGNKPRDIPIPSKQVGLIEPLPLLEVVPGIPIRAILVCPTQQIPDDEKSLAQTAVTKLQLFLYRVFPPMQAGLPPIDANPDRALKQAYTWLHRTRFAPPDLPAEFLGSPDLGSLAVRGPYAGYLEKHDEGVFKWDLESLNQYECHEGLYPLGVKVFFEVDEAARSLRACRIDSVLGTATPADASWNLSKKLALCALSTHLSLVRHFNWVHLAGGAQFATATRNRLPSDHPLLRLLWPYAFATAQSQANVTPAQMLRGGDFETIFSFTFEGMCKLFEDTYHDFRIVVNDPEKDAEARRIRDAGFDTPTMDELERLFAVMHGHATDYLRLYYPETSPGSGTAAVREDEHILAWLDELNALLPNGAGVSRDGLTFESLARLVARFIFLATAQHELLGSFMWNYQLWTHRQPARVYRNGQREPLDVYQRLVNANYNLNVTRRELMFDFSYLALEGDDRAASVLTRFQEDLEWLQMSMASEPWAIWRLYPRALKVNINA